MSIMRPCLIAAPLWLVAACSVSTAPDNGSAPAPRPVPAVGPSPAPTLAADDTPVRPGELKTFGDWAVGCDNVALCTMASLGPDAGLFPDVTLTILRQPGPDGAFDLAFDGPGEGEPTTPVAVRVDGARIALPTLNDAPAAAVVRAIANGRTLTVLQGRDRARATISLKGASAALRWIDAQQGRVATVTALVARGSQPAATVPEAHPAPVVRALITGGTAVQPNAAQTAAMRKRAGCDDERIAGGDSMWQPEAHALGGGTTLILLPCSAGAYNMSSTLFVLREGKVEPAQVDAPSGFEATPAAGLDALASVVNGDWKNGELTSYAKGRGLGDCGVSQTFVWDGSRLRLTEQAEMSECRGNPHYLTTWRTQVVRAK